MKSWTIFALQNVPFLLGRPLHWTLITIHQPTSFRKMPTLSTDGSKRTEWQLLGSPHQGPNSYNSTLCLQKKNENIFCRGKLLRNTASFGTDCWGLLSQSEFGVTIACIVPLPLSFITYVCVDWCKTTMLVHTVALYSNNNSATRCSYSALDVYPTNPCVYAQYPVAWNTSTRGSLGKSPIINFLVLTIRTEAITDCVHFPGSCE